MLIAPHLHDPRKIGVSTAFRNDGLITISCRGLVQVTESGVLSPKKEKLLSLLVPYSTLSSILD